MAVGLTNNYLFPGQKEELLLLCNQWRRKNIKIVFTNGVFDLLHAGHIEYLSQAAALGDRLIVGINSDKSAQLLEKGPARPIKDENTRLRIAASLRFVDIAVLFDEPTPLQLITSIQPDVLVKGGDYNPDSVHPSDKQYIVGSDIVRNNGGQVYALPFLSGHSTTALEQKILKAHRDNGKG